MRRKKNVSNSVGIGHDDDFVVAQLFDVGFLAVVGCSDRNTESFEYIADFLALEHFVIHRFFYVQDFTAQRQDSLEYPVPSLFCRSACRITLDEEDLADSGVFR